MGNGGSSGSIKFVLVSFALSFLGAEGIQYGILREGGEEEDRGDE